MPPPQAKKIEDEERGYELGGAVIWASRSNRNNT